MESWIDFNYVSSFMHGEIFNLLDVANFTRSLGFTLIGTYINRDKGIDREIVLLSAEFKNDKEYLIIKGSSVNLEIECNEDNYLFAESDYIEI